MSSPKHPTSRLLTLLSRHIARNPSVQFSACALLLFALLTAKLEFTRAWAFGDHFPFPPDRFSEWSLFSSNWNWTSVGLLGSAGSLQGVILGPLVAGSNYDGLVLVACLIFSTIGMFILLRDHTQPSFAAVGALFYGLNPVTVATFIGGSAGIDSGYLELYAFFPIYVFVLLRALRDDARFWSVSALCVGVAIGVIGGGLQTLFWMYVPPTLVLILVTLLTRPAAQSVKLISRAGLVTAFAAPLLLSATSVYGAVAATPATYTQYAASSSGFIYGSATVFNLLRGAGSNGNAQLVLGYNGAAWWVFAGLAVTFTAIVGLLVKIPKTPRYSLLQLTAAALLTVGVGLAAAIHQGFLYSSLATNEIISGLDDIERVQFWIVFSISTLIPGGLVALSRALADGSGEVRRRTALFQGVSGRPRRHPLGHNRRLAKYGVCIAVAILVLVSNLPALDGSLGLGPTRSDQYQVPGYYSEVSALVASGQLNLNSFRILWLPYTANDLARQHWLSDSEINPPYEMSFFNPSASAVTALYQGICDYNNTLGIQQLLNLWGVEYVIIDWNESQALSGLTGSSGCAVASSPVFSSISASPAFLEDFMQSLPEFREMFQTPSISVYVGSAAELAYLGKQSLTPPTSSTVSPFQQVVGPSIVKGGAPINTSDWRFWPASSLAAETTIDGTSGLSLNLSSANLTVAEQNLSVTPGDLYNVSYAVLKANTYARATLTWYANDTAMNQAISEGTVYLPGVLPPQLVSSRSEYSAVVSPPSNATVGVLQLLVGGPAPSGVSEASAVFADASVRQTHSELNNTTVVSPATQTCPASLNFDSPSSIELDHIACSGNFTLELSTAYSTSWVASVISPSGAVAFATDHGVGNFVFNAWTVHLSPGDTIHIEYGSQAVRSAEVTLALAYIPTVILAAVLLPRIRRRLLGSSRNSQSEPVRERQDLHGP